MTLSIIIPVFNTEAYLEKCVLSCLGGDSEIVIVNDGSTDGSPALARKLAGEHPGIAVISQENAGLSAARNAGLRVAKGDYVWFVDSDDSLTEGSAEWACTTIKDHPCDYISVAARNNGTGPLRNVLPEGGSPAEVFRSLKWLDCATMYIWRRGFLQDKGLSFMEGIFFTYISPPTMSSKGPFHGGQLPRLQPALIRRAGARGQHHPFQKHQEGL